VICATEQMAATLPLAVALHKHYIPFSWV